MSLRIIAPKPAELESTNVAPSKLTFTQFDGGGNHFVTFGWEGAFGWLREDCWNSKRLADAIWLIIAREATVSPTRSLLRLVQI